LAESLNAPGTVVSPYPKEMEHESFAKDGTLVRIRPIKPEDALSLLEFFHSLSERTVFLRFLSNLRSLPLEWLKRFTQIDYSRDVALVATRDAQSGERILGVCRIMRKPGSTRGEIAIVVSDSWQDKGIGMMLLHPSLAAARKLGIKSVWGLVSAENAKVLAIAEKLGVLCARIPDSDYYELELQTDSP